jgi:hypothetical protein
MEYASAQALRPLAKDARGNPLHFVFAVEPHLFQFDFFQEVFGTKVGGIGDSLDFRIVLPVLLGQTPIFSVGLKKYVPRCPLRARHAFLLTTS